MTSDYKPRALKVSQGDIEYRFKGMHPTHEAEAYREVEKWAGEKAAECEERNDRDGVPELPRVGSDVDLEC